MAKRKFTVRNPEAFAARQRKAAEASAAKRRSGLVVSDYKSMAQKAIVARWGNKTAAERFWALVRKSSECWTWLGFTTVSGYGKFRNELGRSSRAHRFSWELANGPIPDGLYVLHRCDNRCCVRPDHLFLGTQTDNMRDAKVKGRAYRPGQHNTQGADGRWQKKN